MHLCVFQGIPVTQNVSWGVIISTRSLVLQRVGRNHSGMYACSASNDRGETSSSLVSLRVHCKYIHYFIFKRIINFDEKFAIFCESTLSSDIFKAFGYEESNKLFKFHSCDLLTAVDRDPKIPFDLIQLTCHIFHQKFSFLEAFAQFSNNKIISEFKDIHKHHMWWRNDDEI